MTFPAQLILRAFAAAACMLMGACVHTCDLAIVNGRVVDGTGAPPRAADVLVTGDTIRFVGRSSGRFMRAREIVDARERIVAPGFIDLHAHGNPLENDSFANFLLQGATTIVLGQDGTSVQDTGDEYARQVTMQTWRAAAAQPDGRPAAPITLAQWMTAVESRGIEINIATLSGHGTLRSIAGVTHQPTPTQAGMSAMEEILAADLAAGAFGFSSGLEYVPGRYATTAELVDLARVVGPHGVVMSHLRSEDDTQIAASIDELIAQGREARVNISHLKIVFGKEVDQARAVLAQIAQARARGIRISADVYPYDAGFADMSLVYPPWAKRRDEWERAVRERRADLEAYLFERVNKRNGPQAILIASGPYTGRTLAEVAAQLDLPFVKVLIDVFGFGGPAAAHRVMSPEVQEVFVTAPDIAISTDGAPSMRHPRSWGTYPKILQEYVAARRALTVEQAVYKMSALPAAVLGVADRGRLAPGMKADIVVFDLEHVASNATWADPARAPSGIDAVIVNGIVAARNGRPTGRGAGHVLRRARGAT